MVTVVNGPGSPGSRNGADQNRATAEFEHQGRVGGLVENRDEKLQKAF